MKAMEESGRIRRGYFVSGLGGAQFALPGAVDRLRAAGRDGRDGEGSQGPEVVLVAATDPANPLGVTLPWPVKGPARVPGAYVLTVGGRPSLYIEKGGRGLVALRETDGSWEETAVTALSRLVGTGRWHRLALQRYPEYMASVLEAAGFTPTPKGLVLYH
jgi:ATP-dependent Lhr-like helicase